MRNTFIHPRSKCYRCYRPASSCMCPSINPLQTQTKFILLMHPKEFKKTKNGTGHLTHLSLPNSELYIHVDFSEHKAVNALINDPNNRCYLLYPGKESINLNTETIHLQDKQLIIFILDSTWPCSLKMLRLSRNLQLLPKVSFTHTKTSQFKIKEQPEEFCLSTIESTLTLLELLNKHHLEKIMPEALEAFLDPFNAMVAYQISCASRETPINTARFRRRG
ncbi:MAG: DTW domain-containing protein [Sulfuricurvum sp.]|nr:DTW domain-containing protein [Sulfuricurvum sp.]